MFLELDPKITSLNFCCTEFGPFPSLTDMTPTLLARWSDSEHNHRAEIKQDSFFGLCVQKTAQPANFGLMFFFLL